MIRSSAASPVWSMRWACAPMWWAATCAIFIWDGLAPTSTWWSWGAESPWPKRWPPSCIRACRSSRLSGRRCCAPAAWRWSSSGPAKSPIRPIRASPPSRRGRLPTISGAATSRSMRWRGRSTATPSANWSIRSTVCTTCASGSSARRATPTSPFRTIRCA